VADDSSKGASEEAYDTYPLLDILIHDPVISLEEAVRQNVTKILRLNADGMTDMSIGLHRVQKLNSEAIYNYESTVLHTL
jgi:hypothetical protein